MDDLTRAPGRGDKLRLLLCLPVGGEGGLGLVRPGAVRGAGLARGGGEQRPGGGGHCGLTSVLDRGGVSLGGHHAHAIGGEPETVTWSDIRREGGRGNCE